MMIVQFRLLMITVKVVTINTWKCDGDYLSRMQILADQLDALKPAIIACQECFYSDETNTDTLRFLAGRLKMTCAFVPGRFKKRYFDGNWVDSASGLGILSAYPIGDVRQCDLPAAEGDEDRKAQQATIILPSGKKVSVTNTHLTHLKNTPARKRQAEALAGIVTACSYDYTIICGDFNALPGSIEVNAFMKKSGAIDCYAAGNGPEPRYSLTNAFTRDMHLCVDHIFALPVPGQDKYPGFINSSVVLNTPDKATGLYPSDHFGICTELITD